MKVKKIALLGSTGRMGINIRALLDSEEFKKNVQLVWSGSGRELSQKDIAAISKADCLLDVGFHKTTLELARLWKKSSFKSKAGPRFLVCTTGFTDQEKKEIQKSLGPKLKFVPNTSPGIRALQTLVPKLMPLLGPAYHVEIFEAHHALKKDAPSGTALLLAEALDSLNFKKIAIHSYRGGTNPGEHRIVISGPQERIELSHFAEDRILFARGALELALSRP